MAKKLKIRIPDKKEDILLETTQRSIGWLRRYQLPLGIGGAFVIVVAVLWVYGVELGKRSDADAWAEYLAGGPGKPPETFRDLAEKHAGTTVEPWALLDQAHALSRSASELDRETALELYREIARRFSDHELVRDLAVKSLEGLRKEMDFKPPAPPVPASGAPEVEEEP